MSSYALDASAVLALLNQEEGAEQVMSLLPASLISAVNLSEVMGKLLEHGMTEEEAMKAFTLLGVRVVAFDETMALETGRLRTLTKKAGLSLGHCARLALARSHQLVAVSADRSWASLKLCGVMDIR